MCLKNSVIFHMCGEEKVKVAHFVCFLCSWLGVVLLFCIVFAVSVFVVGWLGVVECGYVEYGFPSLSWRARLRGSLSILAM